MNRVLLVKGLIFISFLVGFSPHDTKLIKEIDYKYHSAKSINDLSQLEGLVKKYIEVFPKSDRLLWRLGRIYFKLGDKTINESKKIHFFSLCIKQTQKTIKINSQSARGYFFKGLCNGTLGEIQGIWSSLTIIEPFKKDMETAMKYNVRSVPTLVFLRNGKEVHRLSGSMPLEKYKAIVTEIKNQAAIYKYLLKLNFNIVSSFPIIK